jgi:aminodeoxyfutalosine deaminase
MRRPRIAVTELHLHLEGSLFPASAIELARSRGHAWGRETAASLRRRFSYRSFDDFLAVIREMCVVLCSEAALERAARELSVFLRSHGVLYAEVYVSPLIYIRWGMSYPEVIGSVRRGFEEAARGGGAACAILLDSVRHWGVEAAEEVLESARSHPDDAVVGFGLGGGETVPLHEFAGVFDAARGLGLHTLAHAGETGDATQVIDAIETLGVERIAHGIRAIESPAALDLLRRRRIPLDLAITSNYRTGVVGGAHPIRKLIDEGVIVTLSTDDPSLFRTDPVREQLRAVRFGGLSRDELFEVARNAIAVSFASASMKDDLYSSLELRRSGAAVKGVMG